jgi:hypothetical protein
LLQPGVIELRDASKQAIAPPGQEEWLRAKENIAKRPYSAQTRWLFKRILLDNHPGASRHPSCPGGAIDPPAGSAGLSMTAHDFLCKAL